MKFWLMYGEMYLVLRGISGIDDGCASCLGVMVLEEAGCYKK